jgi:hypothetical protein
MANLFDGVFYLLAYKKMEKLRLINLFAIAFLVSLMVQFWFFPAKNTAPTISDVYISVESDSVVIPNIPKITIHNTTTGSINLNPCDDVSITIDSRPLTGIRESAPEYCKSITIHS